MSGFLLAAASVIILRGSPTASMASRSSPCPTTQFAAFLRSWSLLERHFSKLSSSMLVASRGSSTTVTMMISGFCALKRATVLSRASWDLSDPSWQTIIFIQHLRILLHRDFSRGDAGLLRNLRTLLVQTDGRVTTLLSCPFPLYSPEYNLWTLGKAPCWSGCFRCVSKVANSVPNFPH